MQNYPRSCHAFGFVNALSPMCDNVAPKPECFRPDHGTAALTLSQQFQYPVPASTLLSILSARNLSELYTAAVNPYSVSDISLIASSSFFTFMMPITGPNDSSRIMLMRSEERRVGKECRSR